MVGSILSITRWFQRLFKIFLSQKCSSKSFLSRKLNLIIFVVRLINEYIFGKLWVWSESNLFLESRVVKIINNVLGWIRGWDLVKIIFNVILGSCPKIRTFWARLLCLLHGNFLSSEAVSFSDQQWQMIFFKILTERIRI